MNLNDLPLIMVRALLLTIIFELIVAYIIGIRNKKDLVYVVLVNIMTNPLVVSIPVLLLVKTGLKYIALSIICLELFAVISEGFVYKKVLSFKRVNPFVLSIILNVVSYGLGEIINRFL